MVGRGSSAGRRFVERLFGRENRECGFQVGGGDGWEWEDGNGSTEQRGEREVFAILGRHVACCGREGVCEDRIFAVGSGIDDLVEGGLCGRVRSVRRRDRRLCFGTKMLDYGHGRTEHPQLDDLQLDAVGKVREGLRVDLLQSLAQLTTDVDPFRSVEVVMLEKNHERGGSYEGGVNANELGIPDIWRLVGRWLRGRISCNRRRGGKSRDRIWCWCHRRRCCCNASSEKEGAMAKTSKTT